MAHPDTLYVLAAAYDDPAAAVEDYEAVKALYYAVKTSHDFDAAVIAKDDAGKVSIVKKHEQPTRHGAAVGLGWGLAAGVAAALFPPVGILGALAVGAGGGAAIGAVTGHASGGMSRSDLKELGETLDAGTAGLIVVYEANLAEQVAANIKAANKLISKATDMAADQLALDLKQADQQAAARPLAVPVTGCPGRWPRPAGAARGQPAGARSIHPSPPRPARRRTCGRGSSSPGPTTPAGSSRGPHRSGPAR